MIKKWFKRFAIGLAAVLCILIVICGVLYLQDPAFWKRYYLMASTGGTLPQEGWAGSEFQVEGDHQAFFELVDTEDIAVAPETLAEITAYAEAHRSSSLLVWHQGQLILREHFDEYDSETLIIGKSMAKMVLGILVGLAMNDGHIESLDQPVSDFIPEWKDSDKNRITIRHMLHMAAGMEPFYTLDMSPFSNFTRSYLASHNEPILINGYDLINEPGTKYDYSQVVSDLMAIVIEEATGMPYGQYLSEALIQPIGAQGGEVMMNRPNGLAHSGCCLLLPTESWLRIGIMLLNEGEVDGEALLPQNWMDDYLDPSPANPAMGLHIWLAEPYFERRAWDKPGPLSEGEFGVLHSEPYLDPNLFLFDGSGNQVMYVVPSEELVILRTGAFSFGVQPEWDNSYLPNTLIRALRAGRALPEPETLEDLAD